MKLGKSIAGRCAQSGLPIRLADAYADSRFEQSDDERSGRRTGSLDRWLKPRAPPPPGPPPPPARPPLASSEPPAAEKYNRRAARPRCPRGGALWQPPKATILRHACNQQAYSALRSSLQTAWRLIRAAAAPRCWPTWWEWCSSATSVAAASRLTTRRDLSIDHCPSAHAHVDRSICTHARMHACTHARMHACTHARMHACTHATWPQKYNYRTRVHCMHVRTYTYVYVCDMYMCMHMHMHMCMSCRRCLWLSRHTSPSPLLSTPSSRRYPPSQID